jgi:acetyl-CoA carboxylase carboxyltransferase component
MAKISWMDALKDRAKNLVSEHVKESQHAQGKLTAQERIDLLLDKGSFTEIGAFATLQSHEYNLQKKKVERDGVITGFGRIDGRQVFVYSQDFTFMGASMGEMHTRKIAHVIELAMKTGSPIIGLLDSGGARIQEGIDGLDGGGEIFKKNTLASGMVPQISAVMGPCAGIAVYSPALTDFIFMTQKTATMLITGPNVVKSVTGETISMSDLGGAEVHNRLSGVAHFLSADDKHTVELIRSLVSYLPLNNLEDPPIISSNDPPNRLNSSLEEIVPEKSTVVYNVKAVLQEVLDHGSILEVHEHWATNVVVGFGRLNGHAIGFVANQPMVLAGSIDIDASDKIARFVNFCDAFNIPIINFVDVSGFLPGSNQEHGGIIRHGAKVLFAYSQATVPKISLVMRKAYGGAYIALVSKDMGFDKVVAWPFAEIAVMGAEGAVSIVNRKELRNAEKDSLLKQQLVDEYREKFLNPYVAASKNKVDIIIVPKDTRKTLISLLEMLIPKRGDMDAKIPMKYKKHGSMPV